jgi:excisionase family DNA binding protein
VGQRRRGGTVSTLPSPEPRHRLAYKPQAAADALDISRAQLYRLIAAGAIRTVTIGRSRRIPRAELERIVANGVEP